LLSGRENARSGISLAELNLGASGLKSKSRYDVESFNISEDSQKFHFSSAQTQSREQRDYPNRKEYPIKIPDKITEKTMNSKLIQKKRISKPRME
jgi:hypothetical protein